MLVFTQKNANDKRKYLNLPCEGPIAWSLHCESRHFAIQGPWPSDRTSVMWEREFQFQGPCVILYPKLKASTKLQRLAHTMSPLKIYLVFCCLPIPMSHGHCGIVCIMFRTFVVLWKCWWHYHATRLNKRWLREWDSPCQRTPSCRWLYLWRFSGNDSDQCQRCGVRWCDCGEVQSRRDTGSHHQTCYDLCDRLRGIPG